MKQLYTLFLIGGLFLNAFAQTQQIGNSGFETWQNVGSNTEEPTNWGSIKTGDLCGLCGIAPQVVWREGGAGNVWSGTYSARIVTGSAFGNPANGVLTCGEVNAPNTTPSSGFNESITTGTDESEALTDTPDSIVFYAKYTPIGTDSARASIFIHSNYNGFRDPLNAASQPYVVAKAAMNFRTGGVWQRISIPFQYTGPATTPAFILASFTSSKVAGAGGIGSTLYLDEVSLIYNPVITTGTISPLAYYVTATQGTSVSVPFIAEGTYNAGNIFTAQLSDASGSFANPVILGTITGTTSGTINGTIPGGTPSGTGYRIRVVSSNYPATGSINVSDIMINLVSTSISPVATQTIEAGVNGTALTAQESVPSNSQEWKYATVSGGPYVSFNPTQTGSSYTPNFQNAGMYYVVCESSYPGLSAISNEVMIEVADNSITPASAQSLLINMNGNTLTVNESSVASSRVWKFGTTSGGPYATFTPNQSGTTYTPNFPAVGVIYVVCQSNINNVVCTSNEVMIVVDNITLSTGSITGSPFEFSASAPNASVSVPYTIGGTGSFAQGNTFTAQLSDALGSFGNPINIGNVTSTSSGVINASIPSNTPDGNQYRIRVVASLPPLMGSDNGTDLIVDQFAVSITPGITQTIAVSTNGNTLTANESQNSTREWKYATASGGPYQSFVPAETAPQYVPNFNTIGTYYVICASTNQYNDVVNSNEVIINVTNSITLNTTAVNNVTYYVSPSAVANGTLDFFTDVVYGTGNIFTAELSDASGSFTTPVAIGSVAGSASGSIDIVIPNSTPTGTDYKVRVSSSNPPINGAAYSGTLEVVQYEISAAPLDTQNIVVNTPGNTITAASTHPSVSYEWLTRPTPFVAWAPMNPAVATADFIPLYATTGYRYVSCRVVNAWNDTLQSGEALIYVYDPSSIDENTLANINVFQQGNDVILDLTNSNITNGADVTVINALGQAIFSGTVKEKAQEKLVSLQQSGMYIIQITDKQERHVIKWIAR